MAKFKSQYSQTHVFDDEYARDMYDNGYEHGLEDANGQDDGEQMPPAPDDVALTIIGALLVGRNGADDLNAYIRSAWAAVPEFYMAREWYAEKIAPLYFRSKNAPPIGELGTVTFDEDGNIIP